LFIAHAGKTPLYVELLELPELQEAGLALAFGHWDPEIDRLSWTPAVGRIKFNLPVLMDTLKKEKKLAQGKLPQCVTQCISHPWPRAHLHADGLTSTQGLVYLMAGSCKKGWVWQKAHRN
jgi:hypothetical protein